MPITAFTCRECGKTFEKSMNVDTLPECPFCGSRKTTKNEVEESKCQE